MIPIFGFEATQKIAEVMPKCASHPNVMFNILTLNGTQVEDLHRGTMLPFLKGRAMPIEDCLRGRGNRMTR